MCRLYSFGIKVIWKTQRRLHLEHQDRGGAMEADYPWAPRPEKGPEL